MKTLLQYFVPLLFLVTSTSTFETVSAQNKSYVENRGLSRHSAYDRNGDGFEVEVKGNVVFRDDDSGISSIDDGGYFRLDWKHANERIELEARPTLSGSLEYTFEVNGDRSEYDTAAEARMAPIFLQVFRSTGVNAENRVLRILKTDGIDGVFEEISHLDGSSTHRKYLTYFVEHGKLSGNQLVRVADLSDRIKSSGDLSSFLIATMPYYLQDSDATTAYFNRVDEIPSSGDHARVLIHALDNDLNVSELTMVLRSVPDIASSGDKSRVLMKAIPNYVDNGEVRNSFFEAVGEIESSGDRTRVLIAVSEHSLDPASIDALFTAARDIRSSGDKARLLIAAGPRYSNDASTRTAFFNAVNTIPSSGDHARVLLRLLDVTDLDADGLMALLESSTDIASSGDKARVLIAAAPLMTDDRLVEAFLEAAETVASSSDQSRVLATLMRS